MFPLKELAFTDGDFYITGLFGKKMKLILSLIDLTEKIFPLWCIFFSNLMIVFWVCNLLCTLGIADIVSSWNSSHYFWAYFAAIAVIASGASIIINVWVKISDQPLE